MDSGETQFFKRPVGKLLVIEAVLFGVIGLLSMALGFSFSTGLMVVGAGLWFIRFVGGVSAPSFTRGAYSYEMQHHLQDLKDTKQIKQRFEFANDLLLIGTIPLVVGIILSLLRL